MMLVGLTGGVATGKSTVRKLFAELGAETFDADAAVHELLRKGTLEYRKLVAQFGLGVLRPDGELDRAKIRAHATADPKLLVFLEETLHPGVRRMLRDKATGLVKKKGVFIAEIPLLFETGFDIWMENIIVVTAPLAAQLRNGRTKKLSAADIKKFSSRQWTQARKARKADIVIKNDSTLAALKAKTKRAFGRLSKEAGIDF